MFTITLWGIVFILIVAWIIAVTPRDPPHQ